MVMVTVMVLVLVLTVTAVSVATMMVPVTAGWFGRSNGGSSAIVAPDYVRLQVVANSNSDYDQKVKALVSAAVRSVLADGVHVPKDSPSALGFAAASRDAVQSAIEDVLGQCGCTYGVAVHVGDLDFPAKSYGGSIVPPGSYPALRVTLGTGRGDNWWCVLFPPLCFIDAASSLAAGGNHLPGPSRALASLSTGQAQGDDQPSANDRLQPEDIAALLEAETRLAAGEREVVVRSWLWDRLSRFDLRAWLAGRRAPDASHPLEMER